MFLWSGDVYKNVYIWESNVGFEYGVCSYIVRWYVDTSVVIRFVKKIPSVLLFTVEYWYKL